MAAVSIGELVTQLLLETKHVEGASHVDEIELDEISAAYLEQTSDFSHLRLNPQLENERLRLKIHQRQAPGLQALIDHTLEESHKTLAERVPYISSMRDVTIERLDANGEVLEDRKIVCSAGHRHGSLTQNMLFYILDKPQNVEVDQHSKMRNRNELESYYIIDLADWPMSNPIFQLPLKVSNMQDFQRDIENMLFSKGHKNDRRISWLRSFTSTSEPMAGAARAVKAFQELVNSRLSIHFTHLITLAYVFSCVDARRGDFRLPRGGEPIDFGLGVNNISEELALNRSLAMTMAYRGHDKAFRRLESYQIRHRRPSHAMDEIIVSGRRG
jgi:hypothetical protein